MRDDIDGADLQPWSALPIDAGGGVFDGLGWWLTGGASLLLWTGIALLLTTA